MDDVVSRQVKTLPFKGRTGDLAKDCLTDLFKFFADAAESKAKTTGKYCNDYDKHLKVMMLEIGF